MVVNKISLGNYANTRSNLKPAQSVNFCSESESKKPEKKRSLKAKKWGVALVGPFHGNLINGNARKAFAYLGVTTGMSIIGVLGLVGKKPISKIIGVIGILATIVTSIVGRVNAVRNVKPDKE